MVMRARRVIGFGGAFPPYEGLVKKFIRAEDFDQAFSLRPVVKKDDDLPKRELAEMAMEHEIVRATKKVQRFPAWRKELDWRAISIGK